MTTRGVQSPETCIRVAGPSDARLFADLGARTFDATFAASNTAEDMASFLAGAFGEQEQARELADPSCMFFIANVGEAIAGYAKLGWDRKEAHGYGARPFELQRLYVDVPFLGAKVGAALMRACLNEAERQGGDAVWLGVWERNTRAMAFYEQWGFRDVGCKPFLLGTDMQSDRVMVRPLP